MNINTILIIIYAYVKHATCRALLCGITPFTVWGSCDVAALYFSDASYLSVFYRWGIWAPEVNWLWIINTVTKSGVRICTWPPAPRLHKCRRACCRLDWCPVILCVRTSGRFAPSVTSVSGDVEGEDVEPKNTSSGYRLSFLPQLFPELLVGKEEEQIKE